MDVKKIMRKMMAAVSVSAVAMSTVQLAPYSMVAEAADSLKTRDVWCAGEDVNRWESEHFQFIWGKNGADSAKITTQFLEENAANLEACWNVYMNELSMEPPTQSVNKALRDGNSYKVNFYISGTGLSPFADDWAYMGYDNQGYAFMFCCVGAMQNSPNPSWVLPHEFGHVVTAHQLGWNENKYVQSWWEAIANWYREQFLYSDYYKKWAPVSGVTDYFETYMKNLCFTPILGRDNYASWAFLQYITENPDGLPGYGPDFVKQLMQQGKRDEYPYLEIERVSGADIKETLGNYAKRLATLDLAHKADYRRRQQELLDRGVWNWGEIFTVLERTTEDSNYYTVPTERAPQQFGVNIVPLEASGGEINVTLNGLTDAAGADWRACIAVEQKDGTTRYSELFGAGEAASAEFDSSRDSAAYLTVTATPDKEVWQYIGVPWAYGTGEFDELHYPHLTKTRYPYAVTITGAEVMQSQPVDMRGGHTHPNGGGYVAATAKVDQSVYVGKNAKVLGYATVKGNAVIDGYAVVADNATVSGNAVVNGHAVVAERAVVSDNAIISDNAGVMGNATVSGNARVIESGLVFNDYKVSENATVKGVAYCLAKGSASGQAMPDGDYYDDSSRSVKAGSVYGWASPDSYVSSRKYTDGQYAGLEFSTDSSHIAADTYTTTYGAVSGSPVWSDVLTSGRGVMTFRDKDDFIIADSSYAALHSGVYQTAVLLRDNSASDIFSFGGAENSLTLRAENGNISLIGGGNQTVTAENAYSAGEWVTVSVKLSGGKASLTVNNGRNTATASGAFGTEPVAVMKDDSTYRIGGFDGSMDYFRVFFKEAAEPEYYYTEKEALSVRFIPGDVNTDGKVNAYDMALMRMAVTMPEVLDTPEQVAAGDMNGDGSTGVADLIALQRFLLRDPSRE